MTIDQIVTALRTEHGKERVPGFDPSNGNERARVLFLSESPGPRAVTSGYISMDNEDPSARNFRAQFEAEAGISRADIAIWNVVPWYVGTTDFSKLGKITAKDLRAGALWLPPVLAGMPDLQVVCFVGNSAQKAARLVQAELLKRGVARIDMWHTSAQAMAGAAGRQRWAVNVAELRLIAKHIAG